MSLFALAGIDSDADKDEENEGEEGEGGDDMGDGIMAPPDLEAAEQQLFLGADSSDGDKESDASDCSSLQEFEGDESILDKGQDASAASASQGHSHVKQYTISDQNGSTSRHWAHIWFPCPRL